MTRAFGSKILKHHDISADCIESRHTTESVHIAHASLNEARITSSHSNLTECRMENNNQNTHWKLNSTTTTTTTTIVCGDQLIEVHV